MTTESRPRIKITYATLRNDNEELHALYEAGVQEARGGLGAHHQNYIDGRWVDGSAGTFEARSPIDRDLLLNTDLPRNDPLQITERLKKKTGVFATPAAPKIYQVGVPALRARLGTVAVALLALGGVLYSMGAVVYAMRRPDPFPRVFGYHEVFHAMVIAAAALHFVVAARTVLSL